MTVQQGLDSGCGRNPGGWELSSSSAEAMRTSEEKSADRRHSGEGNSQRNGMKCVQGPGS